MSQEKIKSRGIAIQEVLISIAVRTFWAYLLVLVQDLSRRTTSSIRGPDGVMDQDQPPAPSQDSFHISYLSVLHVTLHKVH